ncbi:hypothetical protein L9F63_020707, partial [Diploptera punctata]
LTVNMFLCLLVLHLPNLLFKFHLTNLIGGTHTWFVQYGIKSSSGYDDCNLRVLLSIYLMW